MSVTGAIMTKVLVHINTAIGGTQLQGFLPIGQIKTGEFPHAQAFAPAMQVIATLEWRQEVQEHAFTVVITARGATSEFLLLSFDAIITQLKTDRFLADTVKWVRVTNFALDENADNDANLQTLGFEVVAEVID